MDQYSTCPWLHFGRNGSDDRKMHILMATPCTWLPEDLGNAPESSEKVVEGWLEEKGENTPIIMGV